MEHSALLALHHIDPSRPHERKLPEPYRAIWLNLVGRVDAVIASAGGDDDDKAFRCDFCGKGFKKDFGELPPCSLRRYANCDTKLCLVGRLV
jgi:hypothetical protein